MESVFFSKSYENEEINQVVCMYVPLLEMVLESYTLYSYKREKEGTICKT
jgi:hypothetical protein